jgi:hypothetical protein
MTENKGKGFLGTLLGGITFGFFMVVVFGKDYWNVSQHWDVAPWLGAFLPVFISILCGLLVREGVNHLTS